MTNRLIINANTLETRIALLEQDHLVEFHYEKNNQLSLVGNIYKARVSRVLPGIQAAFVDIGSDRSAFLYAGDVINRDELRACQKAGLDVYENRDRISGGAIESVLRSGQEIVVQVSKDPLGTKGARVTMFLSIPGRFLVFIPDFNHIGISRRIEDEALRQSIQSKVEEIRSEDFGVVIRTAASEADHQQLDDDYRALENEWKRIVDLRKTTSGPALLYREPDVPLRIVRDILGSDVDEIVTDNPDLKDRLQDFLQTFSTGKLTPVTMYEGFEPIFDQFGIEVDLGKALNRKVWLRSGGYLIIEQTEALTSFDVNTGKFVGKHSVEETIIQTNLEAVEEIVSQLRLRNIGGIIIIDFIDMTTEENKERVVCELESKLAKDKARTTVLKVSELGLVEMTRKRTRESLEKTLTEPCPHCSGLGFTRSTSTQFMEMIRDIRRELQDTSNRNIRLFLRDDLHEYLLGEGRAFFDEFSRELSLNAEISVIAVSCKDLRSPTYEIKQGRSV